MRFVSVLIRKIQAKKGNYKVVKKFRSYQSELDSFNHTDPCNEKLLIVRLDDIGDYILFRNTLSLYKRSVKYSDFKITLLANVAWKELFEAFDSTFVDAVIWVNKKKYFEENEYRLNLWKQLRSEGFGTVICPARERPLLLDDICAAAANAPKKIGATKSTNSKKIDSLSNSLYNQLFSSDHLTHEFKFNKDFAHFLLDESLLAERPFVRNIPEKKSETPFILCCIGAAHKSRKWPTERWIELIKLCKAGKFEKYKFVIAGGSNETSFAEQILKECGDNAISIVGKTSMIEFISYVSECSALIGNDSMSVHISVSCNKPTVIISNGNNYPRFTTYEELGLENVITVYSDTFLGKVNHLKKRNNYFSYTPVTKDIASIQSNSAFKALEKLHLKWMSI